MMGKRLAIVGGGASGLAAAIEASIENPHINITVYDRMPKAGKKLLATGNGRCNFSNEDLSPAHFHGDSDFLNRILTSPFADDENFFRDSGVLTYHEDGRIYPKSQQASSIREALIERAEEAGVFFALDTHVTSIGVSGDGFLIHRNYFDAVIVCGGGKSSPAQGSDGSAYGLTKKFGHTLTPLYPALCGLTSSQKGLDKLKGVRCECNAALYCDGRYQAEESGEVQFTDKGISGIPVMNLSHLCGDKKDIKLVLDLCNEISKEELTAHLKTARRNSRNKETEAVLNGIVNNKLGYAVMEKAGIRPHTLISDLSPRELNALTDTLKAFEIAVNGNRGFDNSQVTCGGIKTAEVDPETMMSRLTDGLFFCGEILDIHGDCGGYNLHLAWTTGRIAGSSAAKFIERKK